MNKKVSFLFSLAAATMLHAQNNATIYGLSRNSGSPSIYLANINPNSGLVTNISQASLAKAERVPMCTIDPVNQIYYFVNENSQLVGIDLVTGNMVSNPNLSSSTCMYFDQMFYNTADANIYGLARNNNPEAVYLAKVNPITGVFTNISTSPVGTAELLPGAAIDPVNSIYYFINEQHQLVGLSLSTGAIISSPAITSNATAYFTHLVYNCNNATLYGIARNSSPAEIYLAKIDPLTGIVSHISNNSLANAINMEGATIDYSNNIFYFLNGYNKFIGVDLSSGNVVSSAGINNPNGSYFDQFLSLPQTCESIEPPINTLTRSNIISQIYPQPSGETLNVLTKSSGNYHIEIINASGKINLQADFDKVKSIELNTSKFEPGIYILKISDGINVERQKICVQN